MRPSARDEQRGTGRGRRAAHALAALAGLAASLACGVRETTDAVELWAMGREGEWVSRLLPELEARHPGLRVRVQQIPWSAAHEKLLTAFVGGAMPDVFQLGSTWVPELAALGALEPVDSWPGDEGPLPAADFFAGILDANRIDGTLYAVPWYVDTRVLFYRRDLLAEAGIAEPPRTWAAWREAMERLHARGGPGRHAILLPVREWEVPVVLALQRGATLLRDGGRYGDFRSPAFREAYAFYLGLFAGGLAPVGGDAGTQLAADFAAGRFAFYVTGPWNVGELRRRLPPELEGRWSTAPMPAPDGDFPGVSLAGGASLAVSRTSRRKEDARRVVAFLAEPATQAAFFRLSGDLPARRSAWQDPALRDDPEVHAFRVQLDAVRATPKVPEWERIAARLALTTERVVRTGLPADAALAALDADVDAILAKRRWLLERAAAGAAP